MNAQNVFRDARVMQVRALKGEVERLSAENKVLREENASLREHFALAVVAATDLAAIGDKGVFHLVDGWNLILGAHKAAKDPNDLLSMVSQHLAENPCDFSWVVFDGPKENSKTQGRLRVSYTGGSGPHRADRLICDFLRMARLAGVSARICVHSHDKDLLKTAAKILAGSSLLLVPCK